jgi:hypothetical protein
MHILRRLKKAIPFYINGVIQATVPACFTGFFDVSLHAYITGFCYSALSFYITVKDGFVRVSRDAYFPAHITDF